ncbi:MAG: hypothetical protein LBO74_16235 [Candidatus Symbiothrix sp.]|jgi:hypothetical protein|nr:hypothetical protein [Candidatus Symbiothrix sp.]
MKKTFFLMLTLLFLGAAGAKAQVLIGADDKPDSSAILELRSSDSGLLLPQVKLDGDDDTTLLTAPVEGMLVCNLEGDLPHGVYYWKDAKWTLYIGF